MYRFRGRVALVTCTRMGILQQRLLCAYSKQSCKLIAATWIRLLAYRYLLVTNLYTQDMNWSMYIELWTVSEMIPLFILEKNKINCNKTNWKQVLHSAQTTNRSILWHLIILLVRNSQQSPNVWWPWQHKLRADDTHVCYRNYNKTNSIKPRRWRQSGTWSNCTGPIADKCQHHHN
jgi:hypothetical protein